MLDVLARNLPSALILNYREIPGSCPLIKLPICKELVDVIRYRVRINTEDFG